jgi:putative Mg2+ transporter-C (MgtC) family protein
MTAAIGMACGLGRELTAVLSALLALAVLSLVPHVVKAIERVVGPPSDGNGNGKRVIVPPGSDDDTPQR